MCLILTRTRATEINLRNGLIVIFLSQPGLGMIGSVVREPVLMRFPFRYLAQEVSPCEFTEHFSAPIDVISLLPVTERKGLSALYLCKLQERGQYKLTF